METNGKLTEKNFWQMILEENEFNPDQFDISKLKQAIRDVNWERQHHFPHKPDPFVLPALPPRYVPSWIFWEKRNPEFYRIIKIRRHLVAKFEKASQNYWKKYGPQRATLLYSLQSHRRGKLHIKDQWVLKHLGEGKHEHVKVTRTMADQLELIKPCMAEFITEKSIRLWAQRQAEPKSSTLKEKMKEIPKEIREKNNDLSQELAK